MTPRQSVVVAGGIASGKSQVVSLLSGLGWSVLKADELGHEVLLEPAVTEAVADRWPSAVIGGRVSRTALARAVFADPKELTALERLTHPMITGRIESWIDSSPKPAAVEVSVLKVARADWGALLIVHSPILLRRKRARDRGMAADDVESRMASQLPDSELLARAEIVIDNQGTLDDLTRVTCRFDRWARTS